MYASLSKSKLLALVALVALFASETVYVFADDATSTSFMTHNVISNGFGGSGTSTNFSSVQTAGQTVTGESTSTNFLVDAGYLYFDTFAPQSKHWQWFDDETNETPTVSLAAENVSPSNVFDLNLVKLRISLAETAGIGQSNVKFALQYSTSSDFSSGAYPVVEQGSCTGASVWCYANGAGVDNAAITTGVLSDSDSCVASVGNGCGTHNESGISTSSRSHAAGATAEYEFTIKGSGTVANTVYFFRPYDVVSATPVVLNGTSTYPSLSTQGATLTFTIGGLATSTATGGVSTSINTTSVSVPFGTLGISTPQVGAQRLTVTTNATQGYEIYAYQQQGLVNQQAVQITPVVGTNATPLGWSTGCLTTSTGCYGYHTTEGSLSGNSPRFAADDTYAQFSSNPDEIAYSVGPATNRVTDMVYKVEAHTDQEAGDYTSGIVYIVVPTF
jgi:hypothetical protein